MPKLPKKQANPESTTARAVINDGTQYVEGRQKNGDSRMKTRVGINAHSTVPILLSTKVFVQIACLNLPKKQAKPESTIARAGINNGPQYVEG
jgi:hypothetical protein